MSTGLMILNNDTDSSLNMMKKVSDIQIILCLYVQYKFSQVSYLSY